MFQMVLDMEEPLLPKDAKTASLMSNQVRAHTRVCPHLCVLCAYLVELAFACICASHLDSRPAYKPGVCPHLFIPPAKTAKPMI